MNLRTLIGAVVAASLSVTALAAAPRAATEAPRSSPRPEALVSNNAIHVIAPYKHGGAWVFDDPRRGLVREAFVSGADDWMERMGSGVPGGAQGFTLLFSAKPFPGARRLEFRRAAMGGAWYYDPAMKHEGWLCSTLFDYFPSPPRALYAQVKPRPS